jgi:hypothetical protein
MQTGPPLVDLVGGRLPRSPPFKTCGRVSRISLLRLLALGQTVPDWDERTIEQIYEPGTGAAQPSRRQPASASWRRLTVPHLFDRAARAKA